MTDLSDTNRLLEEWCRGDHGAVVELARRDAAWIHAKIRKSRGEQLAADAETVDQMQDLMVEILRYRPRFVVKSRAQFRALVGRMVQNDLIDRARAVSARPARDAEFTESVLSLDPRVAAPRAPDSLAAQNEDLAWIRIGLEFLDDEPRQVVMRHLIAGVTFVRLAEELGVSTNTLRMRYHRAVARLSGIVERLQSEGLDALMDGDAES